MGNPMENPLVRHGIGLGGAVMIALVGVVYLDGTLRLVAFGIAAVDLIVTPQVLKYAAAGG
jgi:hypothetical protein